MKINTNSVIDTDDWQLSRDEALELIKEIDSSRGEENFTFGIINMLIESLMEDDGLDKRYILENLVFPPKND